MNEFGISLVWLAIQVGVLCTLTAACYGLFRKSAPTSRASMTNYSMLLAVSLSIVAFCPWPSWLDEDQANPAATASIDVGTGDSLSGFTSTPSQESHSADATSTSTGFLQTAQFFVESMREELRQTDSSAGASQLGWTGWLAVAFVAALGIGLLRMFIGLSSVWKYRRSATTVNDPSVGEMLDVLQAEFSCSKKIELRQCDSIASAATIGWRRPVILLPRYWRSWSHDERRAVLAHEIAHIVHNDFANWLCAQVAVLLHFYQPLMHWLAGRLRLEQELAADAAAARYSGGANSYLKNLAGLAIRQHDQPIAWPARTFLPSKGTLVRRIEMLRDSKFGLRPSSRWGRGLFAAAILGAAVVLSGLRQPAMNNTADAQDSLRLGQAKQTGPAKVNRLKEAPVDLSFVPKSTAVFATIRPASIAGVEGLGALAKAAQQAMSESGLGLKLSDLERITILGFPTEAGAEPVGPEPVVVMQTSTPNDFKAYLASSASGATEATYRGEKYQVVDSWRKQAYYRASETMLISGRESSIKALIDAQKNEMTNPDWAKQLGAAGNAHAAFALDMTILRKELNQEIGRGPAGAFLGAFSPLWQKVDFAVGHLNIGSDTELGLVGHSSNKEDATQVANTVKGLVPLGQNFVTQMEAMFARETDVPPEGKQALDLAKQVLKSLKIKAKGKTTTVSVKVGDNGAPMMLAMALPAIQNAREAARRAQAMNNLKQIMLALHNYHDVHKSFPKPVMTAKDGKTKYSWRVAILPYLDQKRLYDQYDFTQPWDSDANKKVLQQIPPTFRNPNAKGNPTFSSYFVLTGESTAFGNSEGENGVRIRDMRDGTSNTLAVFEVQAEIPWTKPVDIAYDAEKDIPKLKGFHKGGFHAGFCDGSVRFISDQIDKKVLRALITKDGGEVIGEF